MIARWLSIAFHPFVMVGIMVGTAAVARQTAGDAVRSVAIVALFTVIPLFILMVRQVRRGEWDNVDASNRGERPILYFVGGAAVIALLVYVWYCGRISWCGVWRRRWACSLCAEWPPGGSKSRCIWHLPRLPRRRSR